jgi:chromosome segregation ATPase
LNFADKDDFRKREIDDVTDWSEVITAATKIIAFMGKFSIARNRVPSFQIDQIDQKKIPLIQDPESFRMALFEIYADSFEAYTKAHTDMSRIQLKTGQLLRYLAKCMENLKNDDRKAKKNSIRRRLDRIKQDIDDGATISKEVCDAFDKLSQLIGQVIEALMTSLDVKRKEITDEIGDETTRKQQENNYKLQQKKLEAAEENVKEKRKDLDDIGKSKLGIWLSFFRHESKEESLESARQILEDGENKLKNIREKVQNEIEMYNENIESWKHVRGDVDKTLDRNEMLQILNDGLNYLGQYHDKWSGMHRYFIQMSNDLTKILLTGFSAETVEENAIEELNKSLQMTSDFCAKMHHCTIGPNARQSFRTSSLHHIIRNATNNALYSPR